MKATWNGKTIAESKNTVIVEGNHYFPADSLVAACFEASATESVCPWKGTASYAHVVVDGQKNPDAAWFYASAKDAAKEFEGYYAFWKGVNVTE